MVVGDVPGRDIVVAENAQEGSEGRHLVGHVL